MSKQENETKTYSVEVPEGYEIDREKSTFENIVFKPKAANLPHTWEEFCKTTPISDEECIIYPDGYIRPMTRCGCGCSRHPYNNKPECRYSEDRFIMPDKETASAMVALAQLIQLRNRYNGDWKPDWSDTHTLKYGIIWEGASFHMVTYHSISIPLAFKTCELCEEFFKNFKNLIEIAKPLL